MSPAIINIKALLGLVVILQLFLLIDDPRNPIIWAGFLIFLACFLR